MSTTPTPTATSTASAQQDGDNVPLDPNASWESLASSTLARSPAEATGGGSNAIPTLDPIAELQPEFVYSLVAQVSALSMIATLTIVLLGLLLFTTRYHIGLSKVNYALQQMAIWVFLAKCFTSLGVIWDRTKSRSQSWPFMFDYIEVWLPRDEWTTPQIYGWYTMMALTILLCHLTHIHILTLLFPSKLERGLIIGMLGPLALLACGLSFLDLHANVKMQDLGDAMRSVCNASLTLLYIAALLIWGLFINRSRAWQTEGGAAGFGVIAISLGLAGSALNYVEIKEDRLQWLPTLNWCILLWQSWVGFWWWVSAGMYAGEVADRNKRDAEKAAKRARRKARKQRKLLGRALPSQALEDGTSTSVINRLTRRIRPVVIVPGEPGQDGVEGIEMQSLRNPDQAGSHSSNSSSGNTSSTPRGRIAKMFRPPAFIKDVLARLSTEHQEAARTRAEEAPRQPQQIGVPGLDLFSGRNRASVRPLPARRDSDQEADDDDVVYSQEEDAESADMGTYPPAPIQHAGIEQDPANEPYRASRFRLRDVSRFD